MEFLIANIRRFRLNYKTLDFSFLVLVKKVRDFKVS